MSSSSVSSHSHPQLGHRVAEVPTFPGAALVLPAAAHIVQHSNLTSGAATAQSSNEGPMGGGARRDLTFPITTSLQHSTGTGPPSRQLSATPSLSASQCSLETTESRDLDPDITVLGNRTILGPGVTAAKEPEQYKSKYAITLSPDGQMTVNRGNRQEHIDLSRNTALGPAITAASKPSSQPLILGGMPIGGAGGLGALQLSSVKGAGQSNQEGLSKFKIPSMPSADVFPGMTGEGVSILHSSLPQLSAIAGVGTFDTHGELRKTDRLSDLSSITAGNSLNLLSSASSASVPNVHAVEDSSGGGMQHLSSTSAAPNLGDGNMPSLSKPPVSFSIGGGPTFDSSQNRPFFNFPKHSEGSGTITTAPAQYYSTITTSSLSFSRPPSTTSGSGGGGGGGGMGTVNEVEL